MGIRRGWMVALALVPLLAGLAEGGIGISFGIFAPVGPPLPPPPPIYRPYHFHRPYVYVAPAPYYYYPPPVVVESPPAAVVVQSPRTPDPCPDPAPAASLLPVSASVEVEQSLADLRHGEERARAEAALRLGRAQNTRGIDALNQALTRDPAPTVRDAAARALGLLGKPGALAALRQAASNDPDPEVRRSAAYSVEVIQAQLRGR